jgi:UDPglucose 6-dehydrogenase
VSQPGLTQSPHRISVVGLGKLGLPLAVAAASRGFHVLGHDADPARVERLRAGDLPLEPQVAELGARHRDALEFTGDLSRVRETALTFVVVPTPSRRDGSFSLTHPTRALRALGAALRAEPRGHVAVLVSTVLPGDMEGLRAVLEESAGRRCGDDLGLVYNPAFIALGSVVHDLLHPDVVLIGESDRRAGDAVEAFHRRLCMGEPAIERTSFVNAELAKIAVNAFVTMKISFANTMARLCERLPGAHADVVSRAIGGDRRIGRLYLKGALGYGGPCFPRDNRAFSRVARSLSLRAPLAEATDRINDLQVAHLAELVRARLDGRRRVALLGVAYKPDTDVIEASQSVALAEALLASGCRVTLWDPAALDNARGVFGGRVGYRPAMEDAVRGADVSVVVTPWSDLKRLQVDDFGPRRGRKKVLIDCWRLLDPSALADRVDYIALGVGRAGLAGA